MCFTLGLGCWSLGLKVCVYWEGVCSIYVSFFIFVVKILRRTPLQPLRTLSFQKRRSTRFRTWANGSVLRYQWCLHCRAYADYIGFILTLNEGVKGKKLTFEYRVSEAIEKLVALLNTLDRWIDETPPMDQPSRFGNKAYRTWYAKLDQEAENLVATVVPTHLAAAVPEVAVYLKESVGNSTRIDYGTGHEAAFAAFLCCLCKIGVLRVDDQIAIVFKVFNRYLEVMRKLQKTYRMEPAGSQGVWGLDDFQFLPFIWGSSQLIDHPYLEPRHFVDEKAVNENHKDYMFLECILFITEMKTGPFAEHSNQLWNISAVPTWSKVNQGLIRMYKAECLEKFPVIQHFKFGSLLPIHPVSLC
ncbi:PREDICTED: serine/threonine-protein phosphatase 2A activator isoform X2 [Miniopterus natalensis]|uniref:serine/threonine-protein phosphatase 2A activator isoform X2 n=1 Tax=Miniopterus natalensis TaxID=291302 RepID=UPI0007A70945|nr:PREDICTED: serine/threonine-protein phosphatase 2A activator isoform X2 [Miniopterus natalensis]